MPELPEVEALVDFLRERAVGRVVARVDVGAISVLKTYDPPVTSLHGLEVTGVARFGKFVDLDVSGLHLVFHLSRAGWLRWSDALPATPVRPGKSPIALRVRLDDPDLPGDPGFDLTEAGTQKRLAVYVVRDPQQVPGHRDAGPRPARPAFDVAALARIARRLAPADQGAAARPVGDRRGGQRVQRRGAARRQAVAVRDRRQARRGRGRAAL